MHQIIGRTLSSFELGEAQTHANMTIVPILVPGTNGLDYLTMREALDAGALVVSEVSEGGSVPNLKVSNKADKPVLLLDGEEVAGAKQNRVLNTSILVKERSEVQRKFPGRAVGERAKAFLAEAAACEEKAYASVGMGEDYRYSGAGLVGSALVAGETVIHAAFFRVTEEEQAGPIAGMNRRRGNGK